jgi:hypothetical protein
MSSKSSARAKGVEQTDSLMRMVKKVIRFVDSRITTRRRAVSGRKPACDLATSAGTFEFFSAKRVGEMGSSLA